MLLRNLARLAADEPALADLTAPVIGCAEHARAVALAAIASRDDAGTLVVVTPTGTGAAVLADDLARFLGRDDVLLFPAWETLPFERVSPAIETMGRRLEVLARLGGTAPPKVVVASVRAALQRLAPDTERTEALVVRRGDTLDADTVLERLVAQGYRREPVVEHRGEVARRGSIIDVFPSTGDHPVRIDLWGDEVDRLTAFEVGDQRSTRDLDAATILPAREFVPNSAVRAKAATLVSAEPWGREQWERLAEGTVFDGMESWLPWFANDRLLVDVAAERSATRGTTLHLVLVDQRRLADRGRDVLAEEADLAGALASTWARDAAVEVPALHAPPERLLAGASAARVTSMISPAESRGEPVVDAGAWGFQGGDPSAVASRIVRMVGEGWRVVVAGDSESSSRRMAEALTGEGVAIIDRTSADGPLDAPGAYVVESALHHGALLHRCKVALLAESDLTGRRRARAARPTKRSGGTVFEDLKPGSYIVHQVHGVGRYEGITTKSMGGSVRDYLQLAYKDGDRLYVPTDSVGSIRPYVGGEEPTMHRLGGSDFARSKAKVRSAVREVAQELVVLYQRRATTPGHQFDPDTPWQHEMESSFPWVETPDQLTAIGAVKSDMERDVPMDRLVCGDVGFGKTEVAVRAAFKAVQGGKQVAVLVPTTLLASQHFQTFAERFTGYPVRVEVLSRFVTPAKARAVLAGLASGEVDCVIGTHRLLQEGVAFKDLGLLVVDEEQRFGVSHKEAIKRLRVGVDVLTLSATPIPRTLEMSLVGLRDLSLLQTPPADRQPILTFVGEYDERVATEAIRRELLRDGQVFWVHNRVQSIEERAAELRVLVPDARIAVAHGQMDETQLERTVTDFWEGRSDVLVCTTIIESGIDMPAVNTLVVERADLLGLGQLHQLRGRVGRSGSRAYAFLFHPQGRVLGEEAYERLRTIGESTELGSGFRIAMRDLEIRGAGHLLGETQSGHIAAVGYDLYCELVTEAVAEMKGEPAAESVPEVTIDVPVTAHLAAEYVPREEARLEAYRRLAAVASPADVDDIRDEWEDRYGPLPAPAEALVAISRLRAECRRTGIRDVTVSGRTASVSPVVLRASQKMRLARLSPSARLDEKTSVLTVPVAGGGSEFVTWLTGLLGEVFDPAQ